MYIRYFYEDILYFIASNFVFLIFCYLILLYVFRKVFKKTYKISLVLLWLSIVWQLYLHFGIDLNSKAWYELWAIWIFILLILYIYIILLIVWIVEDTKYITKDKLKKQLKGKINKGLIFISLIFFFIFFYKGICFLMTAERTKGIWNYYYKSVDKVYFTSTLLKEADVNSFEYLWDSYAKDKNNVYYFWYVVDKADVDSFEYLWDSYAKDRNNIYYWWNILEWVDRDSFEVLGSRKAKDKNHLYDYGEIVPYKEE